MGFDRRGWMSRAATVALFLCLGLPQGCRCGDSGGGIVATVDGYPISFQEFWEEFKNRYDDVADPSTLPSDVLLQMKVEVLSDVVRRRILLQEAHRRQIHVPEELLTARLAQLRDGYSGLAFEKILLKHRQDPELFERAVTEQLMMEALYREVTSDAADVTEEEIGSYYDDHLDEFLVPETVRMRQMIVKDRARAMDLLQRLRKGQDFSTLAAEHARVPGGEEPGRLETYRRGELPEVLEVLAFSAETGRVTGPVETPYGFHLVRVEETVPAQLSSLDDVREEIRTRLRQERQEREYARWVLGKVRESDIRVHESLEEAILTP